MELKVRELALKVQKFHDDLAAHFDLWQRSLEQPLPSYPVRNIENLRDQMNSLARQLGTLRSYIETLTQTTMMAAAGQTWDAYDSAVSNDVAIRKGSSIEAILPQLQQMLGKLDSLNPDSDCSEDFSPQRKSPQTVSYNIHGAHSRVNIQSEDHSSNVVSFFDQRVFSDIRNAIDRGLPDNSERNAILSKLGDLEKAVNTGDFLSKYQEFISTVANHMTIILPFIPALTQMLGR